MIPSSSITSPEKGLYFGISRRIPGSGRQKLFWEAFSLLQGRGYLGQMPGAHDASFLVITPQGERWHTEINYETYGAASEPMSQPPSEYVLDSQDAPSREAAPPRDNVPNNEEVLGSEFVSSQSEPSNASSDLKTVES